jgi:phosphopantetheine adenylyltransferase
LIEDYDTRRRSVIEFVNRLNPNIKIDTFELSDPVGQAGTDPNLEACILTREVEKGGQMINEARR